ncbi:peroxisomal acyl-coenzyme A oxidase 2 isoform X1 [Xenopus tropicalis]|uniref:Acyl-coenzyme A oxidase n=1 Tax=Xenopus tropicalis TaxID=8364 RepID=A0A6I8Q8D8_XENTR|nr:peroxisomal acyl-coenzyme A oxidase 2 isoform X1 [Xenopus tropicalis]|eukprot:XP_017948522.1 PREDICTED: peroxisomal acyl-coenzyme A oxidase 2 isoform X1 [Xenopus tropicalis]
MVWWRASSADIDVNPDLASERAAPSFCVESLTNLLDGSVEKTRVRRYVVSTILKDPVFSKENHYFKTRQERYEGAIRNSFHLKQKIKELGWREDGPEGEVIYRAMGGELALNIHGVFIKSILALGTDEQVAKWIPLANNCNILGTYAQTELGHVGKTCTHAVVLAHLIIKEKNYGMHPFIVQVRSLKDHSPMPGITVGDIGPKMCFEQIDNGFLMMRNICVPKENMLSRYSEVLPDGTYVKRGSDKINYFTMVAVRVSMLRAEVLEALMKACTISIRYSAVRRQSELKPGDREPKILEYQTQQQKLLPLLATCYAIHFTTCHVNKVYDEVYGAIQAGNFDSLPELHALVSGIKAYATEICSNGIEVCRKACGGHGYSLFSGLPSLYTKVTASCTYEGENTVLHLQAARFLIKCYAAARSGQSLPHSVAYLSSPISGACQASSHTHFLNPDVYIKAYQHRAYRLIDSAAFKMRNLVQSGMEQYAAWNSTSVELVKASIAHTHYIIVKLFADVLDSLSSFPEIQKVLKSLCDLHALHGIFTNSGDFLQDGHLSGKQLEMLTEAYLGLLSLIRRDAVLLVDAFDYADQQLLSALGSYDGNVYYNLLECAQKNPDNKKVNAVFENYLKPHLQSNISKL